MDSHRKPLDALGHLDGWGDRAAFTVTASNWMR